MKIVEEATIEESIRPSHHAKAAFDLAGSINDTIADTSAIKTQDGKTPVAYIIAENGLRDPSVREIIEAQHERLYNDNGRNLILNEDNPDVAISATRMMPAGEYGTAEETQKWNAQRGSNDPAWVVHSVSTGKAFPFEEKNGEPGRAYGETTNLVEATLAAKVFDAGKSDEQNREALATEMEKADTYNYGVIIEKDDKLWLTPISYYESSLNARSVGSAKELEHDLNENDLGFERLKSGVGLVGEIHVERADDPNKIKLLGGSNLMTASSSEKEVATLAVQDLVAGRPFTERTHSIPDFPKSKGPQQEEDAPAPMKQAGMGR